MWSRTDILQRSDSPTSNGHQTLSGHKASKAKSPRPCHPEALSHFLKSGAPLPGTTFATVIIIITLNDKVWIPNSWASSNFWASSSDVSLHTLRKQGSTSSCTVFPQSGNFSEEFVSQRKTVEVETNEHGEWGKGVWGIHWGNTAREGKWNIE